MMQIYREAYSPYYGSKREQYQESIEILKDMQFILLIFIVSFGEQCGDLYQ